MPRIDYHDDPAAPPANSLVPAASAVVTDEQGRILLHRRSDNDRWSLPGGAMELGESIAGCAVRETSEETGVDVEVTGIVGIYSNPGHVFAYDDGEVRQEFSVCFSARPVGGHPRVSEESTEVAWFRPEELAGLPMVESMRLRVLDFLEGHTPVIR
jgi:ADP-ribose pyrophosphatase YjhB (NUDIX family)